MEGDADHIASFFVSRKIARGEYYVQEGQVSKQLGLVTSGFLHYFLLLDGEELTTYTVGENDFIVSLVSFLRQAPSRENIRAVVDSIVCTIEHHELRQLMEELPSFKDFYVGILEWQICCIDESRLDGLTLNAQQRYEKMIAKEPKLLQQVPLQYLASILGVTPRHLSRIRGSIR